jgi:hypothetical protein
VSTQDSSPDDERTSIAHPARRYNYWLGGTENFEADRISADALAAAFPTMRIFPVQNRRFLRRAVTYLVKEAGIRQFLDIGAGIPVADNVHEVAQSIAPDARVVYADNDPIVLAHARKLRAGTPAGATPYIHADMREPDTIFGNAELRETLDLSRPVALMLLAILHFFVDDDEAYDRVTALTSELPPGSYLVMSHGTRDFMSAEAAGEIEAAVQREDACTSDPFRFRDRAQFARFFSGMTLVPPGIQSISDWRNDEPDDDSASAANRSTYGAVARIS